MEPLYSGQSHYQDRCSAQGVPIYKLMFTHSASSNWGTLPSIVDQASHAPCMDYLRLSFAAFDSLVPCEDQAEVSVFSMYEYMYVPYTCSQKFSPGQIFTFLLSWEDCLSTKSLWRPLSRRKRYSS